MKQIETFLTFGQSFTSSYDRNSLIKQLSSKLYEDFRGIEIAANQEYIQIIENPATENGFISVARAPRIKLTSNDRMHLSIDSFDLEGSSDSELNAAESFDDRSSRLSIKSGR